MATPLDYIPTVRTGTGAGGLPPKLLKKTAKSLQGALAGELPQDVQDLLLQQAAEYGVASGVPGSQFAAYRGLRNLGLTSLDRIQGAERLLAPNFISPVQAQTLALQAGTTRAGLAQSQAELAQQKALEEARLAQQQSQFTSGQALSREQLAQQANLAALDRSAANYRSSLGLGGGGGGGSGSSGGGFVGGVSSFLGGPLNPAFDTGPWDVGYGPVVGAYGTAAEPATFDFDYSGGFTGGVDYTDVGGGYDDFADYGGDFYDYGY